MLNTLKIYITHTCGNPFLSNSSQYHVFSKIIYHINTHISISHDKLCREQKIAYTLYYPIYIHYIYQQMNLITITFILIINKKLFYFLLWWYLHGWSIKHHKTLPQYRGYNTHQTSLMPLINILLLHFAWAFNHPYNFLKI